MPGDEPKIFVDEDWKEKVQREREEARQKAQDAGPSAHSGSQTETDRDAVPPGEPPEASFNTLVGTLATQAMFALGVIAPRDAKEVYVNLDEAKFNIDLLAMLREKTRGNLSPQEEGNLREAVAEMQRLYVARVQQIQEQSLQSAGVNLDNLRPR